MSPSEQEFCRLDKNNDREITFEEFSACEFCKLEHVRALSYVQSKDITPGRAGNRSDDQLEAYLFKKKDRNKNNRIDRKEWEELHHSLMDRAAGSRRCIAIAGSRAENESRAIRINMLP